MVANHQKSSIQLANPQFIVICLPRVNKNYFGVSLGDADDAKLLYNVIQQLTQIDNLSDLFNLPKIQELLFRRNQALQLKDNHEKYGKAPNNTGHLSFTADKSQKETFKPEREVKSQEFKNFNNPSNDQYTHFWGNQEQEQQDREPLMGGRVSNTPQQFNGSQRTPNNTQRGDLFHGDPNLILLDGKFSKKPNQVSMHGSQPNYIKPIDIQKSSSSNQIPNKNDSSSSQILNPNSLGLSTQSIVFNNNQSSQPSKNYEKQPNQINNISYVQPNVYQAQKNNQKTQLVNKEPPSISSQGYDENSRIYDVNKIDPSLRDMVLKAGIKPNELTNKSFAPIIKALVQEAELRKSVKPEQNQQSMNPTNSRNMNMPQSSVIDQFQPQKSNLFTEKQSISKVQEDHQYQQGNKTNNPESGPKISNNELTVNEKQGLTMVLAHAIEERRKQIQKNDYESEEKSSWENDDLNY